VHIWHAHVEGDMESLIAAISSLPAEVVGTHVLSFLLLPSLVRLDSAVTDKRYRAAIERAFASSAVHTAYLTENSPSYVRSLWSWCVRRSVTLEDLFFSVIDEGGLVVLREALRRVTRDGLVRCGFQIDGDYDDSVLLVLGDVEIKRKVTAMTVLQVAGGDYPDGVWDELENLTEVCVTQVSEQALSRLLLGSRALKAVELWRVLVYNVDTVQALCRHAQSLERLYLDDVICHHELALAVGQACGNLREFRIQHIPENPLWVTDAGLIAVARGCRRLQSVTMLSVISVTEGVLLAFAAHCPDLERLVFVECAVVTDAVLSALSRGCPGLRELRCGAWAITSMDVVDAAQPLLSRLITCPILCAPEAAPAAVARAVSHFRVARRLNLGHISDAHIAALRDYTLISFENVTLISAEVGHVAVDDIVLSAARRNPRLDGFTLHGSCTITETTLRSLTELCSGVHSAVADAVVGDVTEDVLVTLLRSWSQLSTLHINQGAQFADAVLRAIPEHCPELSKVDLFSNTTVTEAAVIEFAALHGLQGLTLPATFDAAARWRVFEAVGRSRGAHGW
jgi:hypothetical protein